MLETETTLGTLTTKEFNTRTLGIYKIVGRVGGVGLTVAALKYQCEGPTAGAVSWRSGVHY